MSSSNKIFIGLIIVIGLIYLGRYLYLKPKFINGESIPDFEAILMSGESFRLSDLRGHFVLLDFWGSWCGPCRKENPGLVEIYKIYKDKMFLGKSQFKIVSVGIETNENSWKRAIEKDGLIWPYHVAEFDNFASPIARAFGVREIPTKYLLNPKGEIISVNPSIKELKRVLDARIMAN